ncbi:MAG: UDP-N-acetylmuramoyl-tripeptide--D-alanyl-D-alanine ligase [Acidimicrobiales bacterium]|nr:MAG: UDP-N-acetylmuramoyl-tripeptide--D-alanyl-D-alanine ligase [Acidimicrobiales bacterium]
MRTETGPRGRSALWTASEVAEAVGGRLVGPDTEIRGVVADSRSVSGGELFVPLQAARDGHEFIADAAARGAVAYLTSRGPTLGVDAPAIVVDDTAAALRALAEERRRRLADAVVVGITGSVGKTTTKDLTRAVLAGRLATHASPASYNNEIGVPLTLANTPSEAGAVVVEMGARGIGHIRELCRLVRPTVGVVTMVAHAHTEHFGSLEAVARAKGELVEELSEGGWAILNADVEHVAAMVSRTRANVVTFGSSGLVRAERPELDDELRPRFRLVTPDWSEEVRLQLRGEHHVTNALAAAAVGWACGIGPEEVVAGLERTGPPRSRMQLRRSVRGGVVIDDCYNANPTSTIAAIDALARLRVGRKVAVLGPMAELGEISEEEHRRVALTARERGVRVVAVGAPDYGELAEHVPDVDAAATLVGIPSEGEAVLVKGSRVAGLERLVDLLVGGGPPGS